MNVSDLFKGEHGMIDENKLVSLYFLPNSKLEKIGLLEEAIEEISNELEIEPEFLFLDPNGGANLFCYWDKIFYFRFPSIQMDFLQMSVGLSDKWTIVNNSLKQKNGLHRMSIRRSGKKS